MSNINKGERTADGLYELKESKELEMEIVLHPADHQNYPTEMDQDYFTMKEQPPPLKKQDTNNKKSFVLIHNASSQISQD